MEGVFGGWVNRDKTLGYASPDDGSQQLFVHKRDVVGVQGLEKGARISFDAMPGQRGPKAVNIVVLAAAPVAPAKPMVEGKGVVARWKHDRGFGFVEPFGGGEDVFVHVSILPEQEDGYLPEGQIVEYAATMSAEGKLEAVKVNGIGWKAPNDALFADVDLGGPSWPEELAKMAEKEPWDYKRFEAYESHPILRSYVRYTFRRLKEQNAVRVSSNERRAAFNTGLVTPNQEEIYGVLVRHSLPHRQPWKLAGFKKASDRDVFENFGGNLPPLADYFEDPSVLLYDRRCPLIINIDHVLENSARFPPEFQNNEQALRKTLMGAQADVEKRVYRNYKTAIPQFYRDKGREGEVQLLLPICLTNPAQADVALTVAKNREGNAYLGSTVLTIDMAYNNARLLSRPDTEWLQP